MFDAIIEFIRQQYPNKDFIPLHEPVFQGREKEYVVNTIESTFVSSVGEYVNSLEQHFREFCGVKSAVATSNGTIALFMALQVAGVQADTEVLTQPLTFVATANAIHHCGATPVFIDVSRDTLGLCPHALQNFLQNYTKVVGRQCINKFSGKHIAACVPMHTFGHACDMDAINSVCQEYGIPVVEDAAEALGTSYKSRPVGALGELGVFSFNGNKTITCGGGGMIVTNDEKLGKRLKHLTTTAKVPHKWEFYHDRVGYNFRLPNLNAALACAQFEQLDKFLQNKRQLAQRYNTFFAQHKIPFVKEPEHSCSNYWLNAILLENRNQRDEFLEYSNNHNVMTRPAWTLMNHLPMYKDCQCGDELKNSKWLAERLVNIPSSVRLLRNNW